MTSDNQGHNSVTRNQSGLPCASRCEKPHTVEITLCGKCSTSVPAEEIRTLSEFCGIQGGWGEDLQVLEYRLLASQYIRSFEAHANADPAVPAEVRLTIGIDLRDRSELSRQQHSDFYWCNARVTMDDGRVHWCDRDLLGVILDVAAQAESFWSTAWSAKCGMGDLPKHCLATQVQMHCSERWRRLLRMDPGLLSMSS